jgi:serine/threonine protein kinase
VAKIYGNRWQISDSLGEGGQGDVFRVTDISGQLPGVYALKRLRNAKRRGRFENEVRIWMKLSRGFKLSRIGGSREIQRNVQGRLGVVPSEFRPAA